MLNYISLVFNKKQQLLVPVGSSVVPITTDKYIQRYPYGKEGTLRVRFFPISTNFQQSCCYSASACFLHFAWFLYSAVLCSYCFFEMSTRSQSAAANSRPANPSNPAIATPEIQTDITNLKKMAKSIEENVFKSLLTTVTKSIQSQVQSLGLPMKGDKVDLNLAVKDLMSGSIQEDIKQMVSTQLQAMDFSGKIADIEKKLADHVAAQTDQLKRQELKNQLIVFGLPEDTTFDNPEPKFLSLCQDKFPGISLLNSDIVFVKRIGKRVGNKNRPVIIEFCNLRARFLLLKNKKDLKGSGVVINEPLTKPRLTLLSQAKAHCGRNNAWAVNGDIFVKSGSRVLKISSIGDINALPVLQESFASIVSE